MTVDFESSPIYAGKKIRDFVLKVTDLFCLDGIDFKFMIKDERNTHGLSRGPHRSDNDKDLFIWVGCIKDKLLNGEGVRATTVVHELIHMMGFTHMIRINGWANFASIGYECKHSPYNYIGRVDEYSRLVVKDLTGKHEVFF